MDSDQSVPRGLSDLIAEYDSRRGPTTQSTKKDPRGSVWVCADTGKVYVCNGVINNKPIWSLVTLKGS